MLDHLPGSTSVAPLLGTKFPLCASSDNFTGLAYDADVTIDSDHVADYFIDVLPSSTCRVQWEAWPSANARALERDNVFVLQLFAAIGNLFISIRHLMAVRKVTRLRLDCGFV